MEKFEFIKKLIDKHITCDCGQLKRTYSALFTYIEQCLERGLIDICEEIVLLDYMDKVYQKTLYERMLSSRIFFNPKKAEPIVPAKKTVVFIEVI